MSRSPTTTDEIWSSDPEDWLPNPHAGEMLVSEFMEPLGLTKGDLADRIGINQDRLDEIITGRVRMSGELDLRLSRYFGMSEGFFLRLQNCYEILDAKRSLHEALDRIVPRAA